MSTNLNYALYQPSDEPSLFPSDEPSVNPSYFPVFSSATVGDVENAIANLMSWTLGENVINEIVGIHSIRLGEKAKLFREIKIVKFRSALPVAEMGPSPCMGPMGPSPCMGPMGPSPWMGPMGPSPWMGLIPFLKENRENAELLSLATLALSKVLDVKSEYHESQKLIADDLIVAFNLFNDDITTTKFDELGMFSKADIGRLMDINAHTTQITKDFGSFLKSVKEVDEKQARKEHVEVFR